MAGDIRTRLSSILFENRALRARNFGGALHLKYRQFSGILKPTLL